jgi:lysozyme family protein
MATTDELVGMSKQALEAAATALKAKFKAAKTQAERDAIEQESDLIIAKIQKMELADLLAAATLVGEAAAELDELVKSAKLEPIGAAFDGVVDALNKLGDARSEIHKKDALPPAESPAPPLPGPPPAPPPLPPAPTGGALPPISTARDFASLKNEYEAFFAACTVRPLRQGNIDYYLKNIAAGRARYEEVVGGMAVPWYFIGLLHAMEAGFNFNRHLHNGDPLTARTVRVPPGRPATGNPPFTWLESARDAVKLKTLDTITDWSIGRMLHLLESFNGFGYRPFKVPTPYLWSFSNLYEKGKYVDDGVYSAAAVSEQCGAAVILKAGQNSGLFT